MGQISPYGCFPTAVINSYIYKNLDPPDFRRLIETSQCEKQKGTNDKVKFLRRLRGVHFKKAEIDEILHSAGIITFNCRRYEGHSAFFFRSGKRIYAINANIYDENLIEEISIRRFKRDFSEFCENANWIVF